MGVVNLTPDSFSDGGRFLDPSAAVDHALALIDAGADWIDLGAESTRPGSIPVQDDEEWKRIEPVLRRLLSKAHISVDTRHSSTIRRAVDAGVSMINNVAGLSDDATMEYAARSGKVSWVAMHMAGTPETMQLHPLGAKQALTEVEGFFDSAHRKLTQAGFGPQQIWMDPGIGFGKTDGANVGLLAKTLDFAKRWNIVIGVSRKSLIGRTLQIPDPLLRDGPSKMLELGSVIAGARMIRTHDVKGLEVLRRLLDESL
jgi:dihydropteroate synthase